MSKVTINLLPQEFRIEELKRTKFYKIQSIGVGIILLLIFLSSLIIVLRILQSQSFSQIQSKLAVEEQKITELKTTQASLLLIKDRLVAINQYLGIASKQVQMYELINKLVPSSIFVNSISVDKSGNILLLATSNDAASIDDLINKLVSSEEASGKITSVAMEGLSRGRDGIYRLSIKINTKS